MKRKVEVPFSFVLEQLESVDAYTKLMFGCTAVYVDDRIVLLLRDREQFPEDNGISIATTPEHHESLSQEFPSMRSLARFGPGPTGWQLLPSEASDFEEAANRVCEMILARDPRIGKVPKSRRKLKRATPSGTSAGKYPRARSKR